MIAATFVFILTVTTITCHYDNKSGYVKLNVTKLCIEYPGSIWCPWFLEQSNEVDCHCATELPSGTTTVTGSSAVSSEIVDAGSSDASSGTIQKEAPESLFKAVITTPSVVPETSFGEILPNQSAENTLIGSKPITVDQCDRLIADEKKLLRSFIRQLIKKSLKSFMASLTSTDTFRKYTEKKNPFTEHSPTLDSRGQSIKPRRWGNRRLDKLNLFPTIVGDTDLIIL
ncbi:Hypothetical protein CINCED_3A003711 [Cinara cedri]|uniref:Uncharacterized protein n=1 Tax=Cinara cedri TaxID=506608 RepID=A0A5E4M434_9HEMI|nr:Hypothetical protein CINCED_3A003711 [Cinara cedri]